MLKRIKLIANPISGGDSRPQIEIAYNYLVASGAQVELFLTGKRGDARDAAADLEARDYDLVLAAGGDGTLNEVANGLAGHGIPLAFLPLGTANVMALEMGIPLKVQEACRIALTGVARQVTLAVIDETYFLMMIGIGFDAAAVRAVNPRLKRYTGKLSYVVAGLIALLSYKNVALEIQTASGETLPVWHAIISNIKLYGGRFVMAPAGGLTTSTLTACVVDRPGRLPLLLFWLRIFLRGYLLGSVRRVESSAFRVSGGGAPMQVDGDVQGETPVNISVSSGLLKLVFPR